MNKLLFISIMIFVAALSRLIPHPGNFTPVMAIALFSGASILSKRESLLIPFGAMLLSDMIIGFHPLMLVVYACMAVFTIFGWSIQKNENTGKMVGYGFFGVIFFFLVTNFAVWASTGMYEKSIAGLIQCYTLGIPFLHNTIASTLLYGVILFGGTKLFEKYELVKVNA